jgi:hypothetical protein
MAYTQPHAITLALAQAVLEHLQQWPEYADHRVSVQFNRENAVFVSRYVKGCFVMLWIDFEPDGVHYRHALKGYTERDCVVPYADFSLAHADQWLRTQLEFEQS